jgi:hypothetical protein
MREPSTRDDVKHSESATETFKGLVYVKHGRIGTRSEGPDYYLQTALGEFVLRYQPRSLWEPDYPLEFFSRRMAEVTGTLSDRIVTVNAIKEILSPALPRNARQIKLGKGDSVTIDDVMFGFDEVTEDSRCPSGAVCLWEGQATVVLWVHRALGHATEAERFSLTLRDGHPDPASRTLLDKQFTLLAVEPYPAAGIRIDPEHYVITLSLT